MRFAIYNDDAEIFSSVFTITYSFCISYSLPLNAGDTGNVCATNKQILR